MVNIALDDIRPIPKDMKYYQVVRNYSNCTLLLNVFGEKLECIDLDYDLGIPEGAREMVKYAEKHFPDTIVTHRLWEG